MSLERWVTPVTFLEGKWGLRIFCHYFLGGSFLINWTIFAKIEAEIHNFTVEMSIKLEYTHFIIHFNSILVHRRKKIYKEEREGGFRSTNNTHYKLPPNLVSFRIKATMNYTEYGGQLCTPKLSSHVFQPYHRIIG